MKECRIKKIIGRQILDSRGNPTVEAEVILDNGISGRAAVPSGASTGKFEAVELRDGNKSFMGNGVMLAVNNINSLLDEELQGMCAANQRIIDNKMIELDGTDNKGNLGANAILGVSLAVARAAANYYHMPLYRYLGGINGCVLPRPMMNIINGGRHAKNTLDFQEFMIMPTKGNTLREGLQMCCETYHHLKKILSDEGLNTAVGDEGGFAPDIKNTKEVLDYIERAVRASGYEMGKDIVIAMDVAASELYDEETGLYYFEGESKMSGEKVYRTTDEMIDYLKALCDIYPIVSIEDGLDEEDWGGWRKLTKMLGNKVQLVGDDLFVTNEKRLQRGIDEGAGNAILIKLNQIGTLSETLDTIRLAFDSGYKVVVSHRSGETGDSTIADLAVAVNAGQIKTGAPCRAERTEKYNQLIRIEENMLALYKILC